MECDVEDLVHGRSESAGSGIPVERLDHGASVEAECCESERQLTIRDSRAVTGPQACARKLVEGSIQGNDPLQLPQLTREARDASTISDAHLRRTNPPEPPGSGGFASR